MKWVIKSSYGPQRKMPNDNTKDSKAFQSVDIFYSLFHNIQSYIFLMESTSFSNKKRLINQNCYMRIFYEQWSHGLNRQTLSANLINPSILDTYTIRQLPTDEFPMDDFMSVGFTNHMLILFKVKETCFSSHVSCGVLSLLS